MKFESENLCGFSKRMRCSKLTEKTILLIKKVYDSKLLEKLMIVCGWRVSLGIIKLTVYLETPNAKREKLTRNDAKTREMSWEIFESITKFSGAFTSIRVDKRIFHRSFRVSRK